MTTTRHTRLARSAPTLSIHHDPLLGYYGLARVAGKTTHSTKYHPTEAEAWVALREIVKTPSIAY